MTAPNPVLTPTQLSQMRNAGYAFVGANKHSAVKVCHWTKRSLKSQGGCYKNRFYGIASHRCLQMSPSVPFCNHACVFCWRNTSLHNPAFTGNADSPEDIVNQSITAQRHLLNGFPGNPATDQKKWEEAQEPLHAAISLDGEPTLYPLLPQLIRAFHGRGITTFLVSNGSNPEMIKRLETEDALPTQLYLSLPFYDEASCKKISIPLQAGAWQKFNESLEVMASLKGKTRTVLRMTVVKSLNDSNAGEYAKLIKKSSADYIEVKAYMALGSSRKRLGPAKMPTHEEIKKFAVELAGECGYIVADEHVPSRVVLLCRDEEALEGRIIDVGAWRASVKNV